MDILLLAHDGSHACYKDINSYFYAPFANIPDLKHDTFFPTPPLGITLLATHLNRNGMSAVPIHNFFISEEAKSRLIAALEKRPFAVGISTTHIFDEEMLQVIVRLVKQLSPDSHIILGGLGSDRHQSLRHEGAITVLGPGENTLLALLKALKSGADISSVPNLSFVRNGHLVETGRADNSPLDQLPEPDWDLYPVPPLKVSVQGSRGCPQRCGFCGEAGNFTRRSVKAIVSEVEANRRKWGIKGFRFTDADIAQDRARAMELCAGLEALGGLTWTCFARADSLMDGELLSAMRRSGCRWVFIGVESGSDRMLKAMHKGCGVREMKEAIAMIRDAGIGIHANFVVGYPGEDSASLAETRDFVATSGLDSVYFTPFQLRGEDTPVYLNRRDYSLRGGPYSWRHATMTSEEARAAAGALTEAVWSGMDSPVISNEVFFSFLSFAGGGGFREEVLEMFRAIRDWHRGSRGGDAENCRKAEERLETFITKLLLPGAVERA